MSEQTFQLRTRHEFESEMIAKAWKDESFKQDLINNSKAVYKKEAQQLGLPVQMPENLDVRVLEETENTLYIVIPRNPADAQVSEELSDEALEAVAGGRWYLLAGGGESAQSAQ